MPDENHNAISIVYCQRQTFTPAFVAGRRAETLLQTLTLF